MKLNAVLALALSAVAFACGSQIEELKSSKESSSIGTTESDGVVSGTFSASTTTNQKMVGAPGSKAADASITVPPGALAIDAPIAVGEASDQSTAILAEMAVTTAVQVGSPVFMSASSGNPPAVAAPLSIQLPLPLDTLGTTPSGTGLLAGTSKLVLIYLIYKDGVWKRGLIPLTKDNLLGAFLKQGLQGFGYFQIAYLAIAAAEVSENTSLLSPSLKPATTK